MQFFFIFFTWIKDFRMFQYKSVPPIHSPAAQGNLTTTCQRIFKKRHTKPDCFDRPRQIFYVNGRHLQVPTSTHLHTPENNSCYSNSSTVLYLCDRDGLLIHVVISRIIPKKVTNCINSQFCKQLLRLLPDAFYFMNLTLFNHISYSTANT